MTHTVALLFGVHAHQPAGNFAQVIEHAHTRCYAPFLRTLADYPDFRFAVHVSGPLIEQLGEQYPDDVALLRTMVARGQVEMFGAGDAEPVLAAIPHRDRVSQIESLAAKLERMFGARPRGAWLTERVWESTVVRALAQSGIRYATVDDYHFLCTGRELAELDGYFTTEEEGEGVDVFPISEALRYRIPFAPAEDAVRHLESLAHAGRTHAAIYFDDIEKFGVWPETYAWVYERRWLRDFVERVLASPIVRPTHYAEFHASARSNGIVYLPTTSYIEMNEWALPAKAAAEYSSLVRQEKDAGRFDARKGFIRGGSWRNFMSRYPEANWMHKRMLAASDRLAALEAERGARPALRALLHLAQANDAYWHGLFGGLYLPHLRRGIYANLLRLEAGLDALAPRPALERIDLDRDGSDELFLRSQRLQVALRVDGSAAAREFSDYRLAHNFGDTLRRHPEHYHRLVAQGATQAHEGEGIASAHDRVAFRHAVTSDDVVPDPSPRDLFRDAFASGGAAPASIADYVEQPIPEPRAAAIFQARRDDAEIHKTFLLSDDTLVVSWHVAAAHGGTLATTLDVAMPSCDGFAGRYVVDGAYPCGFGQPLDLPAAAELTLDDRWMRGAVRIACEPAARIRARPYYTVSQSEEGFEKVMQSATLELQWPVAPGESTIAVSVSVLPDV